MELIYKGNSESYSFRGQTVRQGESLNVDGSWRDAVILSLKAVGFVEAVKPSPAVTPPPPPPPSIPRAPRAARTTEAEDD